MDKTANSQETNRRMHPPRPGKLHACLASLCICWKTFSVEANLHFSKGEAQVPSPALRCRNQWLTMCDATCYI